MYCRGQARAVILVVGHCHDCDDKAGSILLKQGHQQLELDSDVCILGIDYHSQCLFYPLESFINVICKYDM